MAWQRREKKLQEVGWVVRRRNVTGICLTRPGILEDRGKSRNNTYTHRQDKTRRAAQHSGNGRTKRLSGNIHYITIIRA